MGILTRVIAGIEYEVVFNGTQSLAADGQGSTLGPEWVGGDYMPSARGRKCERGWHELTPRQVARAHRQLRGELT